MKSQQQALTSILLILLISPTLTWHSLGHLTVARIASLHLSKTDFGKKSLTWANSLLAPLKSLCGEDSHPFEESATWADKIKSQSWKTMSGWHFTDRRYIKPGYQPTEKKVFYQSQNITWAINEIKTHLASKKQDKIGKSQSILGKSISLRNLIHFVGDMHQPLHTTGRVSEKYPNGDFGGNAFYIKHYKNWKWNSLHFIWDHLFDLGGANSDMNSPLENNEFDVLTDFAENIMEEYSYEDLKVQIETNKTVESWNDEGFQITSTFVYKGLEERKELPEEYITEGRKVVKKRLALAGYRLADLMVEIFREFSDGKKRKVVVY